MLSELPLVALAKSLALLDAESLCKSECISRTTSARCHDCYEACWRNLVRKDFDKKYPNLVSQCELPSNGGKPLYEVMHALQTAQRKTGTQREASLERAHAAARKISIDISAEAQAIRPPRLPWCINSDLWLSIDRGF